MITDIVSPLESTIEKHLDSTSRLIRYVDITLSLLIVFSLILGGLFLAILADHWLLKDGLSTTLRFGIFFALFFATGYYIYRKVIPLFRYSISPIYTANLIEKGVPVFKNSLINWLLIRREQLGQSDMPVDKSIYGGIVRTAAINVQTVPTEHPVDFRGLIRISTFFTILLALFIGYTVLSPKSPLASIGRVLFPFSGIERPQAVQFRHIKPGNTTVLQGETVTISAEVESQSPDNVYLVFSTDDGQAENQRIPMVQSEGQTTFEIPFPPGKQGTERGFNSSVDYWIAQGESRSKSYRIDVLPTASIEVVSVQYKFPDYTGLPPETIEHTGDVKALEGTEVTVTVRSTLPLKEIAIVFNDNPMDKVGMKISDKQKTEATGTFILQIPSPHKTFAFAATDENGNATRRSGIYQIEVIPDQHPKVQWADTAAHLKNLRIDLPENQTLQLPMQATDPDFALRYLNLHIRSLKNDKLSFSGFPRSLLNSSDTGPTEHKGQITKNEVFSPEESRISAGDTIEIWVVAKDTKLLPKANEDETDRLTVNIVAPEKKEVQKPDPKQQKEQNGNESDSKQNSEKPQNEQEENDQQQNQSEDKKQDGKEGSLDQSERQEGEQQSKEEQRPDASKESKDEQSDNETPANEQNQKEQNPNGEEQPKKENPDQQPQSDPQAQSNQNQGDSSGGAQQQEGQEGANKGQASDEPSENDSSEGNVQSQENQTGGKQRESNDPASRQDNTQGSSDSGKPQEGQPSDGADSSNTQNGNQQGNGENGGQDSGKRSTETPVNPETQDGDAMERIVEQMKEEGKFDNNSGNPSTQKSMGDSTKQNSPLSGLNQGLHNDNPNSRRDNSLDPHSKSLSNQGNDPSNPQQSAQMGEGKQQSQAERPRNGEQRTEQQSEFGSGLENTQELNQHGALSQEQSIESTNGKEQTQSSDTLDNKGEPSQGTQQQGNSSQERSDQGEQGSESQKGDAEQQQSTLPKELNGQQERGQQGNSSSVPQSSQGNQEKPNQSEGQKGQQMGGTGGGGGKETKTTVEDPNLEYADKVTNLVLEYLEDQLQNKPNNQLLKKLGWSEEQLRQFYDKWQKMASENRTQKQEEGKNPWEDAIKSLGLTPNRQPTGLQKKPTTKDKTRITESQRFEPPAAMKDKYKRYTEGIGQ